MSERTTKQMIEQAVLEQVQTVFDPEIPVNIFELGLIYELEVTDDLDVNVLMTLTAPNCPVADSLPLEVRGKIMAIEGVNDVDVQLTFDPPWSKDMMSENAMIELGLL
jgi:FeS assembly SUF system protein